MSAPMPTAAIRVARPEAPCSNTRSAKAGKRSKNERAKTVAATIKTKTERTPAWVVT